MCFMLGVLGALGILIGNMWTQQRYTELGLLLLAIVLTTILVLRQLRAYTQMFHRMLDDIRYHDFSLHYTYKGKSKTERQMVEQINEVISQLKQVHLGYEKQMQYYKTVLDAIDSCIVVSNNEGKVSWCNRCAEQQLCGHAFHSLDELAKTDEHFPALLRQMKPGEIKSIRVYRNDMSIDWAITMTEYIDKGKFYRIYHLRNIRLLLEENEMEAWQKLVRVLTHEIMNSIAPIISLSETLVDYLPEEPLPTSTETITENEEDEDDEDLTMNNGQILQQGLATIHRRSKGLLEFVENYRKLTRIGSPILAPVRAKDLLNTIRELYPDAPLVFRGDQTDFLLMIDRTQVEQVLINLIKNANEACEGVTEPNITLFSTFDDETQIFRLSITDNGSGILPEVQERIFVPFFTTKTSGSGIGLSICKQIMMLHGGGISVMSVPGKGTTFTLKFANAQRQRS